MCKIVNLVSFPLELLMTVWERMVQIYWVPFAIYLLQVNNGNSRTVLYMLKVNNREIRTMSLKLQMSLISHFKQVNTGCCVLSAKFNFSFSIKNVNLGKV